jgi:hypothetical protein
VVKGNALILKSGGGGGGLALSKEGDLGSTAAFNKVGETFVIVSKIEAPVGAALNKVGNTFVIGSEIEAPVGVGDSGKRDLGMMLE